MLAGIFIQKLKQLVVREECPDFEGLGISEKSKVRNDEMKPFQIPKIC